MNYYNEIDPYAAQWVRNLIGAGLIPPGDVDERSIEDVTPNELHRYTQCHFFAGLSGWSRALAIAGWPSDRPVWTGSCPCQPFSAAGKGAGFADERHLWPAWFHLIRECRPSVIFGEQVASAAKWLNLVHSDLEGVGYAVGAIPIEAASAGADHYRDRYWIVANDDQQCAGTGRLQRGWKPSGTGGDPENHDRPLSDSQSQRGDWSENTTRADGRNGFEDDGDRSLVNAAGLGWGEGWTEHEFRSRGFTAAVASIDGGQYVECPDGKWRRLPPPRVRWLGVGIPARVAKLRAIGNAIDPRPAAQVVTSYLESERSMTTLPAWEAG